MKSLELNGIDFLLMAQNGSLVVDIDENGNILGINMDDGTIDKFDGMLVALQQHTQLLMDTKYTVIAREPKQNKAPQIETSEKTENIEE